jgi:predicted extracellular nuclease
MKSILLFSLSLLSFNVFAQDCSDLFFSEYVEGSSNNKAIEIYNPTSSTIDLSAYTLARYANGSMDVSDEMTLSGSLAPNDVWVITNSDTNSTNELGYIMIELYNMADQWAPLYPSPLYMNGNDAMVLTKNGQKLDIIGKIGEDPGGSWTDDVTAGFTDVNGGAWWTKNHTLIRKASVKGGVTTNPILFDPTSEWDSLSINTWTELGSHTCDCSNGSTSITETSNNSFVIYPNPSYQGQNITLNTKKNIQSLNIFNSMGQKVMADYTQSNLHANLSTASLAQGVYHLSIQFEDLTNISTSFVVK